MYTSMRTRTIVALVVVGAMVPAGTAFAGSEGSSINALVGSQQSTGQEGSGAQSSVNALVGADSEQSPSQPANTSTLNALVGAEPQTSPLQSSPAGADYATVGAIVGDQTPSPSPTAVASSPDDGFDWTDALFGGLAAFGLTALMIVAARSVIRHRRPVAASGA
jgi:hypothetical protein